MHEPIASSAQLSEQVTSLFVAVPPAMVLWQLSLAACVQLSLCSLSFLCEFLLCLNMPCDLLDMQKLDVASTSGCCWRQRTLMS